METDNFRTLLWPDIDRGKYCDNIYGD